MKRTPREEDCDSPNMKKARPNPDTNISEAAKFNSKVLRKLEKAYAEDPEDNLLRRFPAGYSLHLARKSLGKTQNEGQ